MGLFGGVLDVSAVAQNVVDDFGTTDLAVAGNDGPRALVGWLFAS
jgi:hypothetical protein